MEKSEEIHGNSDKNCQTPLRKLSAQGNPSDQFFLILVDRNRLAEALSLGPSTISKLMADEGLPHYKIGKSCRFKVSEVMAFLENRKRP